MDVPWFFIALLALGAFALSVFGLRGLLDIRAALRMAELERLSAPVHWQITRAFCGLCLAAPICLTGLGAAALLAALAVGALGYAAAPQCLHAARRRVEQQLLDELALHLDLIALALEAGSSLTSALSICAERAPDGALRRAWVRVVLEIHAGSDPFDALRGLDQRLGLRAFSTLVVALRSAQRLGVDAAAVLRERARQAAANRFARAERNARAAPLKLWATLMLCIAPCTLLVLAFPVARLLALLAER